MALTRDRKETVAARVQNDPAFAQALLDEEIHKPARSLHRMLPQSGNPTMSNISAVFAAIRRALKVEVHTQIVVA